MLPFRLVSAAIVFDVELIKSGNIFNYVPDMSKAKSAATSIVRLLDFVPDIDSESSEGKQIPHSEVKGHIVLENIHFRYPTRPGTCRRLFAVAWLIRAGVRVLRELSLDVPPGT